MCDINLPYSLRFRGLSPRSARFPLFTKTPFGVNAFKDREDKYLLKAYTRIRAIHRSDRYARSCHRNRNAYADTSSLPRWFWVIIRVCIK